jgi:isopenicillin N synthase-like dioxygenase
MLHFPIVDVRMLTSASWSQKLEAIATLSAACRETGFFCVSGHGMDAASRASVFAASRQFFMLPIAEKRRFSIALSPHNRGYVEMEAERLQPDAPPDRKEAFNVGLELPPDHPEIVAQRPLRGVNQWPDIPGWRDTMLRYFDRSFSIGRIIHRAISADLGLDEEYFDSKIALPAAVLRLLHYPARPALASQTGGSAGAQPGAGEHTDYGNITLLATDGVAGLEVRQLDGTWVEVADTQDLLLCNIGDCLMRWTNDRYRSTPHRVRIPEAERYSIAFFLDANPDAIVEPILGEADEISRYAPISVRDYLLGRLDATYEHRRSQASPAASH